MSEKQKPKAIFGLSVKSIYLSSFFNIFVFYPQTQSLYITKIHNKTNTFNINLEHFVQIFSQIFYNSYLPIYVKVCFSVIMMYRIYKLLFHIQKGDILIINKLQCRKTINFSIIQIIFLILYPFLRSYLSNNS